MSVFEPDEVDATAAWIASVQEADGMIPWYPGGHADPWNHVEAAMALALAGRVEEARAAYEWLRANQLPDGSWCYYYVAGGVEEPRRDPNACAYLATGLLWHHLVTGDLGVVEALWPTLERAITWVLGLQGRRGEFVWSLDADGTPGRFALVTQTASISHSLRCGAVLGALLGAERPAWSAAAARAAAALARDPSAFRPKDQWAMDWYYPALAGALQTSEGRRRLRDGWDRFVMEGLGVRCVQERPWVTAAETAECAMAHAGVGLQGRARLLLGWTRHLRHDDGSYWTGCVHPECVRFPGGERTTYTAAAVLIADHVLSGASAAAALFAAPASFDIGEEAESGPAAVGEQEGW